MAEFEIIITKDGRIKIDWKGYQGETCYIRADEIYEKLKKRGVDVEDREITPKIEDDEVVQEEAIYQEHEDREGIGW